MYFFLVLLKLIAPLILQPDNLVMTKTTKRIKLRFHFVIFFKLEKVSDKRVYIRCGYDYTQIILVCLRFVSNKTLSTPTSYSYQIKWLLVKVLNVIIIINVAFILLNHLQILMSQVLLVQCVLMSIM